ncbi:uncharacterized protein [Physcomitrium patens]|uniref:Uncharacterized protein n=1 Tax=Physcomitrium patens TaxID=3218 RepID=A0A2K1IGC9_PHYPA|nr:uncharacterized protein LOC112276296 [Physcomitrium patens]PNR28332.1 hypothetical protein PHYPA_028924 [Physcomitrium patens]|eukprot:XP_024363203.1 uncharacterized protein LOC112276296 [Physcomitrella patens]
MTLQQLRGVRLRRCQHDDHLSLQASQEFSPHYELVNDVHQTEQNSERKQLRFWRAASLDERIGWLSAAIAAVDDLRWSKHMCVPKGDRTVMETVVNVATSMPFILVGLQTPRQKFANRMFGNSIIGVGIASSLYHSSRGDARKILRFCDYAMIATSTLCLSSALRSEKDNPKGLVMASALMIPFQPMLVTAVHTGLMEAHFAVKTRNDPKLRKAHNMHTMSSLLGGALFAGNHFFANTPYVHAAWHLAAAVSVATLGSMLQDSQ